MICGLPKSIHSPVGAVAEPLASGIQSVSTLFASTPIYPAVHELWNRSLHNIYQCHAGMLKFRIIQLGLGFQYCASRNWNEHVLDQGSLRALLAADMVVRCHWPWCATYHTFAGERSLSLRIADFSGRLQISIESREVKFLRRKPAVSLSLTSGISNTSRNSRQ